MGHNDRIDESDEELKKILNYLLEKGEISHVVAQGITKQVIAKGIESLTLDQIDAFNKHVFPLTQQSCKNCEEPLTADDIIILENGYCSYCSHKLEKH